MNVEFSVHIFEKFSNIEFNDNPFSESLVVLCGRTGGRDEGK